MSDRFHHISIAPADYDASEKFYRDTLGWTLTREWGGKGNPRGAIFSGGGVKVLITESPVGAESGRPMMHLDIHDIDARFRSLAPGTHVVTPPQDTPWGTRWFVVRDPDGNMIAFEEMHNRGR